VYWTNLAILVMAGGLSWAFGLKNYLLLQVMVSTIAGSAGVWLFYVQHQFEGVYGSARAMGLCHGGAPRQFVYKLPKVLQWFFRQHRLSSQFII